MQKYKHVISLGYFCSVALELERAGLRDRSYPFDWCISDFRGVIDAINGEFKDYFNEDLLYQSKINHAHYKNEKYNIKFFHDFDKYQPIDKQLVKVKDKYKKRIERLYNDISEPTLFVRYISDKEEVTDSKKYKEIEWIEQNYDEILRILKSYNSNNEIIFIANRGTVSDRIDIYNVDVDDNDTVARKPLENNSDLMELFNSLDYDNREINLQFYYKKQKRKRNIVRKIIRKGCTLFKKVFFREYIHIKQY